MTDYKYSKLYTEADLALQKYMGKCERLESKLEAIRETLRLRTPDSNIHPNHEYDRGWIRGQSVLKSHIKNILDK